jgi:hypothetical protein
MLFAMASRRRAGWLLTGFFAVTAALSGCALEGSTIAQPGMDPCMTALADVGNIFGIPDLGNIGSQNGSSNVSINSGNTISIQGNQTTIQNGTGNNNVNTCCINGQCCVQFDDDPPICKP